MYLNHRHAILTEYPQGSARRFAKLAWPLETLIEMIIISCNEK